MAVKCRTYWYLEVGRSRRVLWNEVELSESLLDLLSQTESNDRRRRVSKAKLSPALEVVTGSLATTRSRNRPSSPYSLSSSKHCQAGITHKEVREL